MPPVLRTEATARQHRFGVDPDRVGGHETGCGTMRRTIIGRAALPAVAAMAVLGSRGAGSAFLADEGPLPDLRGAAGWLNSAPLNGKSLRGKVVLVNFWTYTCINSLRPLPYLKAWAEKYKDAGLVVIGVHTPEFSFEKERTNVQTAVRDLGVTYPVAIDSDYRIWEAFDNQYWPAMYFVDARGRIRHRYFGEGEYVEAERVLQALLHENGARGLDGSTVRVDADGIEAPPSTAVQSPETYVGYRRGERFASRERLDQGHREVLPRAGRTPAEPLGTGRIVERRRGERRTRGRRWPNRLPVSGSRPAPGTRPREGRPPDPLQGQRGRRRARRCARRRYFHRRQR